MSNENEILQSVGRLEASFNGTKSDIEEIKKRLFGNGQRGALDRITIIEEQLQQAGEQQLESGKQISELAEAVGKLTKAFEEHIGNNDKHSIKGMLLHKDMIVYIVAGFIILHTILEDGGAVLAFILKFLGL